MNEIRPNFERAKRAQLKQRALTKVTNLAHPNQTISEVFAAFDELDRMVSALRANELTYIGDLYRLTVEDYKRDYGATKSEISLMCKALNYIDLTLPVSKPLEYKS